MHPRSAARTLSPHFPAVHRALNAVAEMLIPPHLQNSASPPFACPQLQQDKDMHYWGVKLEDIRRACSKHGITHMRRPVGAGGPCEGETDQRVVGGAEWVSECTGAQALTYGSCMLVVAWGNTGGCAAHARLNTHLSNARSHTLSPGARLRPPQPSQDDTGRCADATTRAYKQRKVR